MRPLDIILGRPQDVISKRPRDVTSRRPLNGRIGSLGDVLGTLEGDQYLLAGYFLSKPYNGYSQAMLQLFQPAYFN